MQLVLFLLLPFLSGALVLFQPDAKRARIALLSAAAPVLGLAFLASKAGQVFAGETFSIRQDWIPTLGLNLAFTLDGLSFLFALLILGIGLLVIIYAYYYLTAGEKIVRFFSALLLFMGAMLGLVMSSNLLLMLLFWELTSLASFLLISFWSHRADARAGARMALAVTGGGGLALLAGILLLGNIVGSFELSDVLAAKELVQSHDLYPLCLILILLGAFTKSAQFPFHFWLPRAMAAPTPVSAYLHSATMVKAGLFLMARLFPILAGSDWWFYLVTFTGLATLLLGAILALFQHDLKGLLAYSTISHLGLTTMLFGIGSDLAPVAAIFHIINHATFKASLFMAAGIIDHETGTRDMRKLSGLLKYMPHTAVLAMVASSAMAGVPLLNGFLSKEMFFAETLTLRHQLLGSFGWLIPALATFAAVFSVAYSLRFIHDVFFGPKPDKLPIYPPHEPSRIMKIPVEILVLLCIVVGMFPAYSVSGLLASAAEASLGHALPEYSLTIWHGFNMPLLMSTLAMLGGIVLYTFRAPLFAWYNGLPSIDVMHVSNRVFERSTQWVSRWLWSSQAIRMQRFGALVFLSLCLLVIWKITPMLSMTGPEALSPVDPVTLIGMIAMVIAGFLTVLHHRYRLLSLVCLSLVGLVTAMLFARFSAPDLALTQLVVEVATILLMLLVLNFMPEKTPVESSSLRRLRDFCIALASGGLVAMLTFAVLTRPYDMSVADFYLANSVSGGGGTNVVNVILVDFRGFDTFGEISVLLITTVAIAALLKGLHITRNSVDRLGRPWDAHGDYMMVRILARLLLPLALLVSVFIFLRGHNEPGGGFIAGLVTAVALILLQVSSGQQWVERRIGFNYRKLTVLGVFIAALTGMTSWIFDKPFLTSAHGRFHIPLIGEIELASALPFDLGVYFTVVGSTLLILSILGGLGREETTQHKEVQ